MNGLTATLRKHNPNAGQSLPDRPDARAYLQPVARVHRRAAGGGRREDGQVRRSRTGPKKPTADCPAKSPMGYYDGNTVTAFWNYAQRFSMSDDTFGTTYGPSTRGRAQPGLRADARRDVYGQIEVRRQRNAHRRHRPVVRGLHEEANRVGMSGPNIGDLLTGARRHVGLVPGRLQPDRRSAYGGTAICATQAHEQRRRRRAPTTRPHHEPFQYYASTSNPHHLPPTQRCGHRHEPTRPTTSTTSRASGRRPTTGRCRR